MKTKLFLLIAALPLLLLGGCESFLDKESYTDQEEEVLQTAEGIEALLSGVYNLITDPYYYGRAIYGYEAAKGTDFFVRQSSGNNYERENRYAESTSSAGYAGSTWRTIYSVIRTATDLLEHIDAADLSETAARRVRGEGTALRALAYFDLMRLFAYPPRFSMPDGAEYDESYRWGVPIIRDMDMVNNVYKYDIRRETAETTFNYIEEELLAAQALLEGIETEQGHINYVATTALLARLYLYESRWEDVVTQGELAVRAAQGRYALLDYDKYKKNYYQPFNSENIWELKASNTDNNGANDLNYMVRKPTIDDPSSDQDGKVSQDVGYGAYGLLPGAQSRLNAREGNAADVRSYLICDLGVSSYKGCRKYIGDGHPAIHNTPIVRLPELYLTLAEAYLNLEDRDSANSYYKLLRAARVQGEGFLAADIEGCKSELYDERRRELILEGHNFWDYFRRGETMVRNGTTIENINNSNRLTINFGYGSGKSNARQEVIYPIPLGELEANVAIRDQQNPGYDSYDGVFKDN